MPLHVLGVSGSRNPEAGVHKALELVLTSAGEHGASTGLLDLSALHLPMFHPGEKAQDESTLTALAAVKRADVIVLGTPDYHGAMSGVLKNFLDHFWSEYSGKLFGYVVSSHERGLTVMDQMRTVVRQCYAWSLPYGAAFVSEHGFAPEGTDAALAARLHMMGRDLTVYGEVLRRQFLMDLAGESPSTFAAYYREQ